MNTAKTNFNTNIDNSDDEIMFGHATVVRRRGNMVEKTHRKHGDFIESPDVWMYKMQMARDITDALHKNPAYHVPRTQINGNTVLEEFVDGTKLADLPDGYVEQNQNWIIPAVANVLNDLSELQSTETCTDAQEIRDTVSVPVMDYDEVSDVLSRYSAWVRADDINFIRSVYKYLLSLPESHELVFSHNDLSSGNVFIDTKTKHVSFIDFEVAGFNSKLHIMYGSHFLQKIPGVWNYINTKLHRVRNKNLVWNYDADKMRLYNFVWETVFALLENDADEIERIPARCAEIREFMTQRRNKFRAASAYIKSTTTPKAMPGVEHDI